MILQQKSTYIFIIHHLFSTVKLLFRFLFRFHSKMYYIFLVASVAITI
nr:MAG TPA: hypothetical protein [Caudoviricetes sp.]